MKQITFILLLSLSFVLGACNAFLDITPQSDYTVEEGYKKESDFEQAISAVYGNNNFCIIRTLVGLCISITVVMIREMQITWADLLIHLTRVSGLLPGKLTGL